MTISTKQLAKALQQMIAEQPKHEKKIVAGFISYLEEKQLLGMLSGVVKHLSEYKKSVDAIDQVKITVAHKVSDSVIESIKKHIKAEKAETVVIVDNAIQGGFQAEYQYKIYDGSVSYQLKKAKKILLNKN